MLPKSYIVAKWTVYALATLALFALQHLILNHITILGVTPFLYPMIPAIVASYEGLHRGSIFALAVGVVCDLLIFGPFDGFFTVIFALIGILSALISENLFSPGWLCGLVVSLLGLGLTLAARLTLFLLAGEFRPLLMLPQALIECAISLPVLFVAVPLYEYVHRHCAAEY